MSLSLVSLSICGRLTGMSFRFTPENAAQNLHMSNSVVEENHTRIIGT